MCQVDIVSWRIGLRKIELTKLLRSATNLTLSPAKKKVDDVLSGETVRINFDDKAAAANFCKKASELGAVVSLKKCS